MAVLIAVVAALPLWLLTLLLSSAPAGRSNSQIFESGRKNSILSSGEVKASSQPAWASSSHSLRTDSGDLNMAELARTILNSQPSRSSDE